MIFLTVGHQTPFDRLVMAMDKWAAANPKITVEGQIGDGEYQPEHFPFKRWLDATQFEQALSNADYIVAHAGTGTIINALEKNKPVLVLPRLAALGETRNDHQVGTSRYFADAGLIQSIENEEKLAEGLTRIADWRPSGSISHSASQMLLGRLGSFLTSIEESR